KKKNWLEWILFGFSGVGLVGVIYVLINQSLTAGDEPADLIVNFESPLVSTDQVRVPVNVRNEGDIPAIAAMITIEGSIGGVSQSCSLYIDHVPPHSKRRGWISFAGRETPAGLVARVVAYMDP
nr:hypothetical protein [Verrucomicrobiales bacterium]